MNFNWQLILQPNILTYEDYKTLCGKLKIGDKIKHKGWSNVTTIDIIGDNMCLEPREKIYVSCEVAIHEENVDWKATYYANLKGDQTMTKIDIRKNYDDGKIRVTNEYDYTEINLINGYYKVIILYVGENGLSLTQANTILAPFGYELYSSTDWSTVEVGTKVVLWQELNATFFQYIPTTKQILVMEGGLVKVYNESEVSL